MPNIFESIGLPEKPVILAPLAGVSDIPFRRICTANGADLTYVEMLSAVALNHRSERTLRMMRRHKSEKVLGVQVTAGSAEDMGKAVEFLDEHDFDTIDLNMGCPVKKVVKSGCGSAILKDVNRVFETTKAARLATKKPLSVKIRLGWDANSKNYIEVGKAAQDAGADWITMHGRTRNDDYSVAVDINALAELKSALKIPVIGNGNLMMAGDAKRMLLGTELDGLMVSRGALGNPWLFREIKGATHEISLEEWGDTVVNHLVWQKEEYGEESFAAVCMRKHLLWYVKGWPGARKWRERITSSGDLANATSLVLELVETLKKDGILLRTSLEESVKIEDKFVWDPKFDMNRQLDRGVGLDGISE